MHLRQLFVFTGNAPGISQNVKIAALAANYLQNRKSSAKNPIHHNQLTNLRTYQLPESPAHPEP